MEAMEIRVFSTLLLLSIGGFKLALTETQSLQNNVTQMVGTNVVIPCVAVSMTSQISNPSWIKNPHRVVIYDSATQSNLDSSKYSVGDGNNTLTVMNAQLIDATTYCCVVGVTDYCANVVLIDSLTASMYPSTGVNIGDIVNLTCTLNYNAPPMDTDAPFALSLDQDPDLAIYIGPNEITNSVQGEMVVGTSSLPHSKSISFNKTVVADDAYKNLTCMVSSANPQWQNQSTTPLDVFAPTKMAKIIYPNGTHNPDYPYPINSQFRCVGDGFPLPSVQWFEGNTPKTFGQQLLGSAVWKAEAQGRYNLICSAKNTLSPNSTYNATRVTVGNYTMEAATVESTSQSKVGLGVGLGIGLGVPILIGLIVLVVILARRKKKDSGPYPVKQPETKAKSPSTGKAPNGKNGDPTAVPRNNVNPNPNPTYATPVMPEQTGSSAPRNVRDSPGYGDLGVRHIGGSGSNPHLNESFDSKADASFDSSRNHSAGGNIAFKAGRTSQSPSAPNTSV